MKSVINWEAMRLRDEKLKEERMERQKWKELTSCQKLILIPMDEHEPLKSIPAVIAALVSPWSDAEANLTWTLVKDSTGFVLKVHAQKDMSNVRS